MTTDPLELASRRRIYRHIQRFPGKYLRELQRDLQLAMGALEYHLRELERADLVTVLQEKHKRFFANQVDASDRRPLALLRQEIPRRILLASMQRGWATRAELAAELDLPRSTLNHHMRHLLDAGLITVGKEGRESTFQSAEPDQVVRLLVAYQDTWLDRLVDTFLATTGALR